MQKYLRTNKVAVQEPTVIAISQARLTNVYSSKRSWQNFLKARDTID